MAERSSDRALSGWWLILLRIAWLPVGALGIGLYVVGIPIHFAQWMTLCRGVSCGVGQLTPEQAQQLSSLGLSLVWWASFLSFAWTIPLLVTLVVAAVIFWRKPDDRMALFASFVLILSELGSSLDYQSTVPVLQFLTLAYGVVGTILIIVLLFVFPDGRFVPRWTRWLALLIISIALLTFFVGEQDAANNIATVGQLLGVLFQINRYFRVSNAVQRQQTKWVVFGLAVSLLVTGAAGVVLTTVYPIQTVNVLAELFAVTVVSLCIALIPVSIGIAILRSRLWEIDIIIRRTLIYGALTAILVLFYFASVVVLQQFLRSLTGQGSDLAIIASTLALAAVFNPLRRRVQTLIDHRFYRRKYDTTQVLAAFGATVRDEVDLRKLTDQLLTVVEETMQPAQVNLWLRESGSKRK